jgi:hypothetical protein
VRLELSGRAFLPLVTVAEPPPPIIIFVTASVTSVAPPATRPPLTVAAHHATGRRVALGLLDVRRGDNLGGEMQPLAEVLETFWSERVVVVLPGELGLEVVARGEGLASFDDLFFFPP